MATTVIPSVKTSRGPSLRNLELVESGEFANLSAYDNAKPGVAYHEDASHLIVQWIRTSIWRSVLFYLASLASCGILTVLCINYTTLQRSLTSCECAPEHAEYAALRQKEKPDEVAHVVVEQSQCEGAHYCCFEFEGVRYFATSTSSYKLQIVPEAPVNFSDRFVSCTETGKPSREYLSALYGLNRMHIQAADPLTIIVAEVVSPFYLFQYFAIAVWLYTDYVIYSVIVMFITFMSIVFVCKDKLFNLRRLHDLAGAETVITVLPTDKPSSSDKGVLTGDSHLVPGDVFAVTSDMILPCDAILLRGRVVVDESMLTGESVPVTKTEFRKSLTDSDATRRTANILYAGTRVQVVAAAHSNDDVTHAAVAMAYKTSFRSAKGQCVAALITPKTEVVSFLPDAMWAILFMVIITTAIFGWSAAQLKDIDTSDEEVVLAYLTALTIAVPPGLVACLSIATTISVVRLQRRNISITDTTKLNAAGYVSYASFDKTGTLTDENICYQGTKVYPTTDNAAALEALTKENGVIGGDPLEVELMRASGWSLAVSSDQKTFTAMPPDSNAAHVIARQFEFSPEKLRAGTVVQHPSGECIFLVKGSPEMIVSLVNSKSVPATIDNDIAELTKQGYRVLALAYRNCTETAEWLIKTASQDQLEAREHLLFLGLVYFSNKLKTDTYPLTIQSLRDAAIHVNMITGDHFHTAIAISHECNILSKNAALFVIHCDESVESKTKGVVQIINVEKDAQEDGMSLQQLIDLYYNRRSDSTPIEIVMTGAGLRCVQLSHGDMLEPLARITSVFARMKPSDKKTIVQLLRLPDSRASVKEKSHVIFCGDGANDMEALSAATVGVSLCDTSTTVAAAIVSTQQTPLAVVDVLKEGRCSLITAYVLVEYNIMYAIIQLFMTCYLNNVGLVFGDYMYLVQDLFFSLLLGLAIADTGPADQLHVRLPPKSLFSPGLMVKLALQLGIFPAIQAITLEILYAQDWFTKFETDDPLNESWAHEGAVLNIIALAQLMIGSVVVTIGHPFRQAWYTNWKHLVLMLLQTGYIFYLLFGLTNEFMVGIDNKHIPNDFAGILLALIALNVVVSAAATKAADLLF